MPLLTPTNRRLFISWVPHARRSNALAEAVGAEAIFIYYFRRKTPLLAMMRYILAWFKSWRLLLGQRPELVMCINQPIFCVLACYWYSRLSGAQLVLDHHAGAFNIKATAWARPLLRQAVRAAALNIVANAEHQPLLASWGGRVVAIGTIPFAFGEVTGVVSERPLVTCVSTFSADEPIATMLAAAELLPEVDFRITGNLNYAPAELYAQPPANVTFTDFLPDNNYVELLAGSDVVVCLTTRDNTLQRGAYEAMSLGRPVVTSDWPVLREAFPQGTLFVENTPAAVAAGVGEALARQGELIRDMQALLARETTAWQTTTAELRQAVGVA